MRSYQLTYFLLSGYHRIKLTSTEQVDFYISAVSTASSESERRVVSNGVPVIQVGPVIEFDFPLPLLLSSEMQRHDAEGVRVEDMTRHLIRSDEQVDTMMSEKARDEWHIRYISYFKDLCKQAVDAGKTSWEANGCPLFTSTGEPLLFDKNHLTLTGSLLFAGAMREQGSFLEVNPFSVRFLDHGRRGRFALSGGSPRGLESASHCGHDQISTRREPGQENDEGQ